MDKTRRYLRPARRAGWLLAARMCLAFLGLVCAASISVTSTTYQAEFGSTVSVATGLLATDKGFSLSATGSSATGTSCGSAIMFAASPKTANTTITAGHLVYDVQVNQTSTAPVSTKFNVTLVLASNPYGPLCIQTTNPAVNGETIDCRFDVGTSLPASPYAFKVTVQ